MLEPIANNPSTILPGIDFAFKKSNRDNTDTNNSASNRLNSGNSISARPPSRAEFATRLVVRLVSNSQNLEESAVMDTSRGSSEISRARQIAMYLLHTSLSMPYGTVARLFGRDRTTVAHACRTIEDLRDVPASDDEIVKLEGILELLTQLAGIDENTFAVR